jgi:tetratricopeptide (TPR) repeat protein
MAVENDERWARLRSRGRGVVGAVVGCFVLGGVLMVVPPDGGAGREARVAGVVAEAVAAAPGPEVLVRDREARVRARPGDPASWAVLGTAYVERARRTGVVADYPKAERALRTSLRLRPHGNADALDGLTALANARRDFRAAKRWGEEAVRVAPGRWTSYALLIDAYDGLGRYQDVRRTLEELMRLRSGPAVRARAARVYWDQGRREDAATMIADAAAAAGTPAERSAWRVRAGELAWERGEPRESLRYCTASPTAAADPDAGACRGRALAALGRTAEAVRAYRAALSQRGSAQVALELGELYESMGRVEAAEEQYGVVRALLRRSASAGVNEALVLGALEAEHGDPEVAVRVLRAEWERQPGLRVADALGWALHRAGKDEEALSYARRATDKERGGEVRSAVYVYHRGEIERGLGLSASAGRHLEEARRINPYLALPREGAGSA